MSSRSGELQTAILFFSFLLYFLLFCVNVIVKLKVLNTSSSSASRLSTATSQRLILPATTTSDIRVISSFTSTAGLRQSDVDDALVHMRQAAKDFQVADSTTDV